MKQRVVMHNLQKWQTVKKSSTEVRQTIIV